MKELEFKKLEKIMSWKEVQGYLKHNKGYKLPTLDEVESIKNTNNYWLDSEVIEVENGVVPAKVVNTSLGMTNVNTLLTVVLVRALESVLWTSKVYYLPKEKYYLANMPYNKKALYGLDHITQYMNTHDLVVFKDVQ